MQSIELLLAFHPVTLPPGITEYLSLVIRIRQRPP